MNIKSLRARQPKPLLRTDVYRSIPPKDLTPKALELLSRPRYIADPSAILFVYRKNAADGTDVSVAIRAFVQLGFLFDPNSFFSTADKQVLTRHRYFKCLAHDLTSLRERIPDAAAPVLLYAMTCLEYRCAPLLPTLLDAVERHLKSWSTEVLTLLMYSLASLGFGHVDHAAPLIFETMDGDLSRDYSSLCRQVAQQLHLRDKALPGDAVPSLHGWARAAFAVSMAGLSDFETQAGGALLPKLVANACEEIGTREALDASGWAQFFLYQILYCVDVEKPRCEEDVKRAIPMWIQERLHERWLDSIILQAQPQGADRLQSDVDQSLRRTNTQALLNCSCGRPWDEQHCWFAGFYLEPKVALECDSMMPMQPGHLRPSGWLAMKSRLLRKMGFNVVTIHRPLWERLTEDQKDEQILRLRTQVGYRHSQELERQSKRTRQKPHVHKGTESRKRDWHRLPMPPSDVEAAAPTT